MAENILAMLFEHNNWANQLIVAACFDLTDGQLDAEPSLAAYGTIRETLLHLVFAQMGYLSLLTLPVDARTAARPAFPELPEAARFSGEGLLALARDESGQSLAARLQTTDGFFVAPWVVMLQAINHATEHREQIKGLLSALGVTPPELDGWRYGEVIGALIPIPGQSKL